jgi:hypothetical protein
LYSQDVLSFRNLFFTLYHSVNYSMFKLPCRGIVNSTVLYPRLNPRYNVDYENTVSTDFVILFALVRHSMTS